MQPEAEGGVGPMPPERLRAGPMPPKAEGGFHAKIEGEGGVGPHHQRRRVGRDPCHQRLKAGPLPPEAEGGTHATREDKGSDLWS